MKKFLLLLVILFSIMIKGVAEEKRIEDVEIENRIYKEFLKDTIPEKFVDPFYELTYKSKNIGIEILGIGFHESEWSVFIGKPNKNGSIDIGPLMLNSYNISNENFMKAYGKYSDDYKYDTDVYYMTVCITFFKALRNEYGSFNALKVYNGGPRVMKSDCKQELLTTVNKYANTVYKRINQCSTNYKIYKENNEKRIITLMIEEKEEAERIAILENQIKEELAAITFECKTKSEPISLMKFKKNLFYVKRNEIILKKENFLV